MELGEPDIWNNQDYAQKLGKERSKLETVVSTISDISTNLAEMGELLEMVSEENDDAGLSALELDIKILDSKLFYITC